MRGPLARGRIGSNLKALSAPRPSRPCRRVILRCSYADTADTGDVAKVIVGLDVYEGKY